MPTTGPVPTRRVLAAAACLALLLVAAGPSAAPAAAADCSGTGSTVHRDLAYKRVSGVPQSLLSLDLYEPTRRASCGPAPLVVYVHGGGFRIGDKGNKITDKVNLFTGEGWAFASVNYRLSTTPPPGEPPVRYPTHEHDVAAAVDWIRDHAGTYDVDPGRIALMGHSSGAFIASLVSTDLSFLRAAGVDPTNVRATVSLDTEYDIPAQISQGGNQEALYRNAFGDDPAVWRAGSPINHTASGQPRPPFLVFTRGAGRRVEGSQAFVDRLRAGRTAARLIDVTPLDHEQVNAAVGQPGDTAVTPELMGFLRAELSAK